MSERPGYVCRRSNTPMLADHTREPIGKPTAHPASIHNCLTFVSEKCRLSEPVRKPRLGMPRLARAVAPDVWRQTATTHDRGRPQNKCHRDNAHKQCQPRYRPVQSPGLRRQNARGPLGGERNRHPTVQSPSPQRQQDTGEPLGGEGSRHPTVQSPSPQRQDTGEPLGREGSRHPPVQSPSPQPLRTICVTVATPVSNWAAVSRLTPRMLLICCSKSA